MNTLKETITKSNSIIAQLDEELRQVESSIITQETVYQQAVSDHEAKEEFYSHLAFFENFNTSRLSTVAIDINEIRQALTGLRGIQTQLKSINVYPSDQKKKLDDLKEKKEKLSHDLQNERDMNTSYKLQLRVVIEKQRQELLEMEQLLKESEQQKPEIVPGVEANKQ